MCMQCHRTNVAFHNDKLPLIITKDPIMPEKPAKGIDRRDLIS